MISSDFCRGLVADDENDQSATTDAFDVLHYIAGKRLAAGRLTVIDATNVQREARAPLVALAREHDVLPVAIVLNLPESVCASRNAARPDRDFGPHVLRRQHGELRKSLRGLQREGFRTVHVLSSDADIASAAITRTRLYNDLRHETGPFDVIGDVHGCRAELESLLASLGYVLDFDADGRPSGAAHPEGRRVIFLGDLVDRGPDSPGVLRLVMGMVAAGTALCVPGNHEAKLLRALRGRNVTVSHGLAETLGQLGEEGESFRAAVAEFIDGLVSHYVLDGGRLVVAHAGLSERLHGRASGRVRSFCLYGQTTGETDSYGLPVRYPWAEDYRGRAMVLYGHTPVPVPEWVNNTMCLDTGCVFGGALTALRYPERTVASVPAARVYYEPARPLGAAVSGGPGRGRGVGGVSGVARREPDVLDIRDVTGRRIIETGYVGRVTVGEANAAAALEVMSRFAIDPRWLIYLPPTMSPVTTAPGGDLLEHPEQAFSAYLEAGVRQVVCEEKHMGSRAMVLVCRSAADGLARFGVEGDGAVWTRTGRPFFGAGLTAALLSRVRSAVLSAGLFDELGTSWVLFDAELMPWSAKAGQLLRDQYAAVGAAAGAALPAAVSVLSSAAERGLPVEELLERTRARAANACVQCRLSAVLLAGGRSRRDTAGAVRGTRLLGCLLRDAAARLAPVGRVAARGRGPVAVRADPACAGRCFRRFLARRGDGLVVRADRGRRRGDGGQAGRRAGARREGYGAAGPEGARPGVPADHLRAGLHRAASPGAATGPRGRPQAVAGAARVLAGPGGSRPGGTRRAVVAGARVRVRRAGAGVRAGGPAPVGRAHFRRV